ncbi:MAG: DUF5667 domain-containing protein [Patescibacteria group bacterium]
MVKRYVLLVSLMVGLFIASGSANYVLAHTADAAEEAGGDLELENVGILPNHPLYFLKEWGRKVKIFFTFNPVSKAKLELDYVGKKAAEIKKMGEVVPQKIEAIGKALKNYEEAQARLRAKLEALKESAKNPNIDELLSKLGERVADHIKLFEELREKFEDQEEVKNAIEDVREKLKKELEDDDEDEMEVEDEDEDEDEARLNATVTINSEGFSPKVIEVKKGGKVTWMNKSAVAAWPASAMHPTHKVYPGSGVEKCGTAEASKIFDACAGIPAGGEWSFQFNEVGSWKYHDHLNASHFATVEVVE